MLAVLEVWQAILVKKLDLDSSWVKQSMSEGARQLLKVDKAPPPQPPCYLRSSTMNHLTQPVNKHNRGDTTQEKSQGRYRICTDTNPIFSLA